MAQLATKVKDHFLNPRNVGKMDGANAVGSAGNPGAGSGIKLFLKLNDGGNIERVSYQIFNNAPAIAPASAFSELAAGMKISDALEISKEKIMEYLEADASTAGNIRYDVLNAFANAVAVLHGEADEASGSADPELAANRARDQEAAEERERKSDASKETGFNKPKLMIMQLVQDVLDSEIRPAVAMDGGDVELVDIEGKRVMLRLHGHCVGCSSSNTTMRFFIEDRLRELVDPGLEVVDMTEFEGETHAPPGMAFPM